MDPVVANDGLAGLRSLRSEPPDAVVLDLMLPGVDGWHVIRQVREWAPRLPIIVVTARTNEHDRVEVLSSAPTTSWRSPSPCASCSRA